MNSFKITILGLAVTASGTMFGAEVKQEEIKVSAAASALRSPQEQERLDKALHAATTVPQAKALVAQGADVRSLIKVAAGNEGEYQTVLCDVLTNLNKEPALINYFASQGVTLEWAKRHPNGSYPLLREFIDPLTDGSKYQVLRELNQVKDRCARIMRMGALVSTPITGKMGNMRVTKQLSIAFDQYFDRDCYELERRYLVALSQTILDTGHEQYQERCKIAASYVIDPVCKKELEELAEIQALLDQPEAQEFMEAEKKEAAARAAMTE